jgi:N-acetyl-alpha-D-glucosaminyl L-malate synthase BshA
MRIGITCYPTFGGSGVVATELGIALARGGDDVHFISYALPSRLNILHERVHFHEVTVTPYPLFDPYPPYTLALATKMAEVADYEKLDVLHVHYAIPHAISAHLAKQILGSTRLRVITTLHGTDITLVGRDESYLPITKFGIEVSDGVTAVSEWLRCETAKNFATEKPIDVIPNFVDPSRFRRDSSACSLFGVTNEKLICHVSNFRPVKRIMDVLGIFERVTRVIPSRLVMIGDGPDRSRAEAFCREHHLRESVFFLGNVPNLEEIVGASDLFLIGNRIIRHGGAGSDGFGSAGDRHASGRTAGSGRRPAADIRIRRRRRRRHGSAGHRDPLRSATAAAARSQRTPHCGAKIQCGADRPDVSQLLRARHDQRADVIPSVARDLRLHPDPTLRTCVAVDLRISLVRIHHLADVVLGFVEIDRRQKKIVARAR